ncbi:MAG: hypothetical protein WD696_12590 [Bryobacteraceae bacterium]
MTLSIQFLIYLTPLALAATIVLAETSQNDSVLAVFVDFDRPPYEGAVVHMKKEAARLMKAADVRIEWRALKEAQGRERFDHVAVIRFRGSCRMEPLRSETGTSSQDAGLGATEVEDGKVLPFGDVNCDLVRDHLTSDEFTLKLHPMHWEYGRALGYVVAHELYHMLTRKTAHDSDGVSKASHTPADWRSPSFRFDSGASRALQESLQHSLLPSRSR